MMALFSEGFLWSLFCLNKELLSKTALLQGEWNTGQLGKVGGCFCLCSSLLPPPPLPPPSQLSRLSFQQFLAFLNSLSNSHFAYSVTLTPSDADAPFDKPVILEIFQSFICFFSPRLEVCGMRLKDSFLTHGGLALWSRKHKWCGCLSVPLCCCPPPPPAPSSSLPLLHSSLGCTLCPCHSLTLPFLFLAFPPLFPIHRAAGARGLSDGFHGYWLQRLDTSSQLPVVVRQPDIHSYIARLFFSRRPSAVHLFHSLFCYCSFSVSPDSSSHLPQVSCILMFIHVFSSSLIYSLLIFLFLLALCLHSQVRHQPQLI